MSIVRSLLIKVGFLSDKPSQQQFLGTIRNARIAFLSLQTAALYAAAKIGSFFGDIGRSILTNDDLARTLGSTLERITGLQRAFGRFQIDEQGFRQVFSRLNALITGYRTRTSNELKIIADKFKFNLDEVGNDSEEIFNRILKYIGSVSSETERIRLANLVFEEGVGARISEMSQNIDLFKSATDSYIEAGKQAKSLLPDVKEYNIALFDLTNRWNDFATSLGATIFPAIRELINLLDWTVKGISALYDSAKGVIEFFTKGPESLINASEKAREIVEQSLKYDADVFRPIGEAISNKLNSLGLSGVNFAQPLTATSSSPMSGFFGATPVINLNTEINVAPGTTEEQAQSMADSIREVFDDSILNIFKMIQYNNPRTE